MDMMNTMIDGGNVHHTIDGYPLIVKYQILYV